MLKKMVVYAMALLSAALLFAQADVIPFDDAHWQLANAKVIDYMGRSALMGVAALKNSEFENGVIEYDIAVSGARSYPGVIFRSQPDGSWERFYIRPHRSGRVAPSLYSDVLQYVPSWNRVDSWQLYAGLGYTAGAVIPAGRWLHVKIEVAGEQARVFVDNSSQPNLVISRLRHGARKGGITLMGPADGSAYFSNFSVRADESLAFTPLRRFDVAPGFIHSWQVSQALPMLEIDDSGMALPATATPLQWRELSADEFGLLDISRIQGRSGRPDTVFLKTVIRSERAEWRPYKFGYSDAVSMYINGQKIFSGDSSYQGRDPSFLGIVGLNDTICLPLIAGNNELIVALSEVMGGWGFVMQAAQAEFRAPGVRSLWKTGKVFATPESVAYDPQRHVLYVSNYDPTHTGQGDGGQAIHSLSMQGGEPQVLIKGVRNPTGLAVYKELLYAVEAKNVVEISIVKQQIVRRIDCPGALNMNDIAIDAKGVLYVSDPAQGAIYRVTAGKAEVWLRGPDVVRPNGVYVSGKQLIFVTNGDNRLKAADLKSKKITVLADLAGGILDGLAGGPNGSWLVSHNEGRLFQVSASGEVTKLVDLTVPGVNIADFTYIPEMNLLVYPTFYDNRVMAETLPAAALKK